MDLIFEELSEDPGKAKKYPPEDGVVFATKYRQGFYSYIKHENSGEGKERDDDEEEEQDAK